LIITVSSLTLFFKIGDIPPLYPWSDESEIAADAVATAQGEIALFYPAQLAGGSLAVWLEAGWISIWGKDLLGLRILTGLINIVSVTVLYYLVRHIPLMGLDNRWVALVAALLMSVSTWLLGLGRIATPNWSLVPLMTSLTLICFWRGVQTQQRRYFIAMGFVMGLLFYGYIPGYFVPLILPSYLILHYLITHPESDTFSQAIYRPVSLISYPLAFITAMPILVFFALNPETLLQRPTQLADTNELSGTTSWMDSLLDMGATFGFSPRWFIAGQFEQLAFDPVITILFVLGLLICLSRIRYSGYLFLLSWWGVMILPALLSRSASLGFIFEVWRRGIGTQPVSFIFPAITIVGLISLVHRKIAVRRNRHKNMPLDSIQESVTLPNVGQSAFKNHPPQIWMYAVGTTLFVSLSAGFSYWLYFEQWANSEAIPALFAESPVRMVEWLTDHGDSRTLYLFPIRPNVSPTTRPELFTVRYLYEGTAPIAYPVLDENSIEHTMTMLIATHQPQSIVLMMSDRIPVDPKGYFTYFLSAIGQEIDQEKLPDYQITSYSLQHSLPLTAWQNSDHLFGQTIALVNQRIPQAVAAGEMLPIALQWRKIANHSIDVNVSLVLQSMTGDELVKVDGPLLSERLFESTSHWSTETESTTYLTLPIPPDLPPLDYLIRATLYNEATGEQLSVNHSAERWLTLGRISLRPNSQSIQPTDLPLTQLLDTTFPNGLQLIGLQRDSEIIKHPGEVFQFKAWWQIKRPIDNKIGMVLALSKPGDEPTILTPKPLPLIENYPMSAWDDNIYQATYQFLLPAELKTDEYLLALRLYDVTTTEIIGEQMLMPVTIEARDHIYQAPPLTHQIEANFANLIQLRSTEFELSSTEVEISLQWQALQPMYISYKMFLHLLSAEGQIISQIDTIPGDGASPTTSWLTDEIIEDHFILPVTQETLPNSYRLIVGWYDETTGERLTANQHDYVQLLEQSIK